MGLRVCLAFHLMAWSKWVDILMSTFASSLILILIYFRHQNSENEIKRDHIIPTTLYIPFYYSQAILSIIFLSRRTYSENSFTLPLSRYLLYRFYELILTQFIIFVIDLLLKLNELNKDYLKEYRPEIGEFILYYFIFVLCQINLAYWSVLVIYFSLRSVLTYEY